MSERLLILNTFVTTSLGCTITPFIPQNFKYLIFLVVAFFHTLSWNFFAPFSSNWKQIPSLLSFIPWIGLHGLQSLQPLSIALVLILNAISLLFETLLPSPNLPKRGGNLYRVSTTSDVWKYQNPVNNKESKLSVQIWYPTSDRDIEGADGKKYKRPLLWTAGSDELFELDQVISALGKFGMPYWACRQVFKHRVDAYVDAPIVKNKSNSFPLLVGSHGKYVRICIYIYFYLSDFSISFEIVLNL